MTYALTIGYGTHAVAHGAWTNDPAYLDTMAKRYVGGWLGTILDLVVIFDAFAVTLMFCVVVGHGLFSLARDGLLPKVFAKTSRFDTPWVANLTMAAATIVGMLVVHLANYAKTFGLPNDTIAILSLTTTVGSYLVQFVYLAVVVVASGWFKHAWPTRPMVALPGCAPWLLGPDPGLQGLADFRCRPTSARALTTSVCSTPAGWRWSCCSGTAI